MDVVFFLYRDLDLFLSKTYLSVLICYEEKSHFLFIVGTSALPQYRPLLLSLNTNLF